MQTCNVYSIFQEYIWHFANIGSAKGRLREVVKCVLFTFTLPIGVRSERANPCFLFCFVLPGLLSGKDFIYWEFL